MKSIAPMMTSKRTWPTIMKSVDENARESMAVRQTPSSKNIILSTSHVGPRKSIEKKDHISL